MSELFLSDIDFKTKFTWVWTTLKVRGHLGSDKVLTLVENYQLEYREQNEDLPQ